MKLYMSQLSPYARVVRVLLRQSGAGDLVQDVATDPRQSGTGFWDRNPVAKIPALDLGDGTVITESALICRYVDGRFAAGRHHAPVDADPGRLALLGLSQGVLDRGVSARIEKLRVGAPDTARFLDTQLGAVQRGCDALDRLAPEDSDAPPDILDLHVACAVEWIDFRHPDLSIRDGRPRLAAWCARIGALASMVSTRPA